MEGMDVLRGFADAGELKTRARAALNTKFPTARGGGGRAATGSGGAAPDGGGRRYRPSPGGRREDIEEGSAKPPKIKVTPAVRWLYHFSQGLL